MIRSNDSATNFAISHQVENMQGDEHLFPIEIFIDLANVERGSADLGDCGIDYDNFVHVLLREYGWRLGMAGISSLLSEMDIELLHSIRIPAAICRAVWCVTSVPVNFDPDDAELVRRRRRFLDALRFKYGFQVEELPFNFAGNHVSRETRKRSSIRREQDWERSEKGVDVALAVRLLQRCLSPDSPEGVIVVSGDADFGPALEAVMCDCPGIQVMVAAFSSRLSNIYRSNVGPGPTCQWPPIILDSFLDEFKYERRSRPQAQRLR